MFKKIQGFLNPLIKSDFAKASVFYIIANILGQGVVLFSSAIFTRMMDKTSYGLVSNYSTWVLVINTFICLNLFITVRNAYIDFKFDYNRFASSVLLLSLISGAAISILMICFKMLFVPGLSIEEILLVCVQSIALNVINYELAVLSMRNQYIRRSILLIVPNWAHTALSVILILIFVGNPYMAKISGNAIGLCAIAVIILLIIFARHRPCIEKKYWSYSLRISLPSIFNTLSDLILMQSDRIMITSLVGAAETAEYSVVYNVSSIIVSIYQAINGAWTPWFFDKVSKGKAAITRKFQFLYMTVFTLFSCGMLTIAPELIKIISPPNYWDGIKYVSPIVMASYLIFLYAFFTVYLLYKKRTGIIAINTVISAVTNVGLNYLLIPNYKSLGAVIATVVSYALLFLLHYIAVGKEGKRFFTAKGLWFNLAVMIIYSTVFYFVIDKIIIRYLMYMIFLTTASLLIIPNIKAIFMKSNNT